MASAKEILADNKSVTNQEALVQLLLQSKVRKPLSHTIPGGKSLFRTNNLNVKELEAAVYTWLRRSRSFEECTIGLSNSEKSYKTKTTRVVDFPEGPTPIWANPKKGKAYLASVMAEHLSKGELLSITAKKDGLYITRDVNNSFTPTSEDWEPHIEFVRPPKPSYSS